MKILNTDWNDSKKQLPELCKRVIFLNPRTCSVTYGAYELPIDSKDGRVKGVFIDYGLRNISNKYPEQFKSLNKCILVTTEIPIFDNITTPSVYWIYAELPGRIILDYDNESLIV